MRAGNDKNWWSATVGNTTSYSDSQQIKHIYAYSVSAQWTLSGATTGQIFLQASNDGENWCTIVGSERDFAADGDFLWDVTQSGYGYIRLALTNDTANDVTVAAQYNSKGE